MSPNKKKLPKCDCEDKCIFIEKGEKAKTKHQEWMEKLLQSMQEEQNNREESTEEPYTVFEEIGRLDNTTCL